MLNYNGNTLLYICNYYGFYVNQFMLIANYGVLCVKH